MGKYEDAINAVREFFGALPDDAKKKCSLCNETLTHIVKLAEVETGAGTATVTRVLAEQINDGAVDGDRVSGDALRFRVRNAEGQRKSANGTDSQNTGTPTVPVGTGGDIVEEINKKLSDGASVRTASEEVAAKTGKKPETVRKAYSRSVGDPARASQAKNIVGFAIAQLERLSKNDPCWEEAIAKLENWIEKFKGAK